MRKQQFMRQLIELMKKKLNNKEMKTNKNTKKLKKEKIKINKIIQIKEVKK